ncbi:hypothetical protein SAMN05216588_101237 [Pseudomonas flavescens]|uniref:Uncharacterized protein n=1 Tax=Phytopseudomonas flavescens TaxID=29435 RepID=A0A1G7XR78_9GAMM|nr:hypothetical protein SAMN05216588_101237 [Pseudomonas flavescens]
MTQYQRARRIVLWRSFAAALGFFIVFIVALGLADRIANW